ncbi:MAG TPA: DUF2569 family protein [Terracidiphilus sp.]|jgi:hypothetical protein
MATQCKLCGLHIPDGVPSCTMCGNSNLVAVNDWEQKINPSLPSQNAAAGPSSPSFSKWQWAVALSLVAAPVFRVMSIVNYEIPRLFDEDKQAFLQSHPGMSGLLQFEIGVNAVLVITALVLNFLFYTRRKAFPMLMVAYVAATLLFLAAMIGAVNSMFPDASMSGGYITLVRYLIWAGAIIPYLLTSTEIKTRFVN